MTRRSGGDMNPPVSYADIVRAIQNSQLASSVICLHSSLKSFGYLEGGAGTVVRAFLDAGCTLIVPTFTYDCQASPPEGETIPQNGYDYTRHWDDNTEAYRGDKRQITKEMGAIPAHILKLKASVRGNHPLNSFTTIGPLAQEIIAAQRPSNIYGPYKQTYARDRAHLLLVGVGLTTATPIHFAEEKAGRRLFRRWALDSKRGTMEAEVGGCSYGFDNLAPSVAHIETTVQVGQSVWRIYPFRPFIDAIAGAIAENPTITHCQNPGCLECRDAARGGPLL
jgi:aminoglycoside N3'-acetyltransferase